MKTLNKLTFGFEQTFTIPNWWEEPGFTHVSDTPLKRRKMLDLAISLSNELGGHYKESLDIYNHLQYEIFLSDGTSSFVITMDPGSIEVKTPPAPQNAVQDLMTPLFEAAKKASIVPYRNWWYGIKGGTEGGCHINIGSRDLQDNLFINHPYVLLRYFSILHNHPYLHYPFMGLDVGPGGNAQRMDEKNDFNSINEAFDRAYELHKSNNLNFKKLWNLFESTTLITEKSSAPSLAKLKEPNFVLEDRAQESFRSPEEITLILDLKLKLLELAMSDDSQVFLNDFKDELHTRYLTAHFLWEKFQSYTNSIGINPVPYQMFFERQFPLIFYGENIPSKIRLREGRRPRVILSEEIRGGNVVSKKIDTRYKRFEISFSVEEGGHDLYFLEVKADGIENEFLLNSYNGYLGFYDFGKIYYGYIDVKTDKNNPILEIILHNSTKNFVIEKAKFDMESMSFK